MTRSLPRSRVRPLGCRVCQISPAITPVRAKHSSSLSRLHSPSSSVDVPPQSMCAVGVPQSIQTPPGCASDPKRESGSRITVQRICSSANRDRLLVFQFGGRVIWKAEPLWTFGPFGLVSMVVTFEDLFKSPARAPFLSA